MLRQTVVVGAALAVTFAAAGTASADGWGTVDCAQAPTPRCQLGVGQSAGHGGGTSPAPGTGASSTGSGAGSKPAGGENLANCGYRPSEYVPPVGPVGSGLLPSPAWYEGLCTTSGVIRTPVEVPALTPAEVANLAYSQLGLPDPAVATSPAGEQLVNLPTWLWLTDGWTSVSATASVPGVSVTATANPRTVTWSMGDGTTVRCGRGTPYRAGSDPRAPSPDCGHTYRRSSATRADDHHTVTATVHWSVRWSGAGQSGSFPELTTASTTRLRVTESQALNTGPAPR